MQGHIPSMENGPSYFANSHSFIIESGCNFATVNGNQINNYFNHEPERNQALTTYSQFRQVLQGDIYRTKDIGVYSYPRRWDDGDRRWREEGLPRADKVICAAEVIDMPGRTFTVVSYTGPEAQQALERDFRMFSGSLTASSFQVYGVNMQVPAVLFHNILQPVANFLGGLGYWGQFYLDILQREFRCQDNEVWLDSQSGVVCRGPAGPDCEIPYTRFNRPNGLLIPESAEHLHGDIYLRYLARQKSRDVDRAVVAAFSNHRHDGVSEVGVNQPTIFSTRTNATVAVGGGVWKRDLFNDQCLGKRVVMESGETRFTLRGAGRLRIRTNRYEEHIAWMSQASSVFHALGVSLDDNLWDYELITPELELRGHLSESDHLHQTLEERPIHLFMRRLSPSTSSEDCTTSALHYWSFDPTGGHPLPAETCNQLGLPTELYLKVQYPDQFYWDNESYRRIHEYQLARGFDPTTNDFARHLGYPTYSVQNDRDRFEELTPSNSIASDKTTTQKGFWSKWSWAVSEDSDIPAVGL